MFFKHICQNEDRLAIVDENRSYKYNELLTKSFKLAENLKKKLNLNYKSPIITRSICTLLSNDVSYVVSMFAIWISQGVFVPLSTAYPPAKLKYFINDVNARIVITNEKYAQKLKDTSDNNTEILILSKEDMCDSTACFTTMDINIYINGFKQLYEENIFKDVPALIVYTSGTTSLPKGVVHTFGSIQSQIESMINSWKWTKNDVILHTLPLHHVHGLINALMTPLYCGALCIMLSSFDAKQVWSYILGLNSVLKSIHVNLFMGVPTMYAKLLTELPHFSARNSIANSFVKEFCSNKIRLFVSGSAPLPLNILSSWVDATGHVLLERYGMTEAGMILTNPLLGERCPGAVGMPLKNIEVRIIKKDANEQNGYKILCIADNKNCSILDNGENIEGDLQMRGGCLFAEYLNKPIETKQAFTEDGWFIAGDSAAYRGGSFHILGRTSIDIIKSGGYKISALEVEHCLVGHPNISEIAVIGPADDTWGQRVSAIIVLKENCYLSLEELKIWASDHLAKYQIPSSIKIVQNIEKNAMGKIDKKNLIANF